MNSRRFVRVLSLERLAQSAQSVALRTDFALLIDGKLEQSAHHLDVINPALGTVFARCPAAHARRARPRRRRRAPRVSGVARALVRRSCRAREAAVAATARAADRARRAPDARARQTAGAIGRRDRSRRRAIGRHGRHRDSRRGARRRQRQAHRAALSAARRRRHHHAVERARESGARAARVGALHRQHRWS